MDLDSILTEAAPARHLPLDGPESPAAVRLYQQITQQPPPPRRASRRRRFARPAFIGMAAAAVAAAVALALVPGSPAGHRGGQGGVTLAAWSVVKERHGVLRVGSPRQPGSDSARGRRVGTRRSLSCRQ